MKKQLLFYVLLSTCVNAAVNAQDIPDATIVQKIRDEGLKNSKVMQTAFYLTDVSGPRLAGSPGLKRAQTWAVDQLAKWGCVNAKIEPWGKFGKGWEVQKNYAAITIPYYHAIIAIPKAWTASTNGAITGDVAVIKVDTIIDLDKYKGTLKGKIVMLDAANPLLPNFKGFECHG
jgi:carboxypeptidase Q